jgi:hypothetical protein
VAETDEQNEDVVPFVEQARRNDWEFGDFPFTEHRQSPDEHPEDDETDDGGRGPGVFHASEFQSEEKHEGTTNDQEGTCPVNSTQTSN